ncbi:hydrolase, haloacid dehalogenase-like family [Granulicella sibirica]|uniref:phosphoglycolate phosphatase n=1 Tax=Granulicella sibirica TaxID=2479048 RepID=A0A4Q0SUL0_9BACT|nr:hydrolase, haloacid dehalogenase-like family [Granulicella sibirica]
MYLFDIDGTLLNATDAVHYFAFCDALTELAGRSLNLDGVTAQGNVDNGILRDALALAGVPDHQWRPRLPEMQQRMCAFVTRDQADLRLQVLPQVPEVLDHLRAKGAILGVATGNLEGIGRVKLAHAGLLDRFHFGGYSNAHEFRHEVFKSAVETARSLTRADASICVVGDTPADVRAAHSNGLDIIAVATGIFPLATLQAESPTRAVSSLAELLIHPL